MYSKIMKEYMNNLRILIIESMRLKKVLSLAKCIKKKHFCSFLHTMQKITYSVDKIILIFIEKIQNKTKIKEHVFLNQ